MRAWRVIPAIAASALVASGVVAPAHAAQKRGDLDTSWGNGGVASTSFPAADFASTRDSIVQADGKVIVVGTVGDNDFSTFSIARFTATGQLDASFSGDGMVQVGFGQEHAAARSVAIDSQGRILVTGVSSPSSGFDAANTKLALVRLLPNGTPDPGFGPTANGRVTTAFGGNLTDGRGVAIASGDRPVCVGNELEAGQTKMVIYRYTAAGSLDNSFNFDGRVTLISGSHTYGRSVVLAGDVLYATGYRDTDVVDQPVIARVLATGIPDPTFGLGGLVRLAVQGASNYGLTIAVTPTAPAHITVGIDGYTDGVLLPLLARTSMTGALDTGYGVAGVFTGRSGLTFRDAAVANDGSSVMLSLTEPDAAVVSAIRPDGTVDTSFAGGGGGTTPVPETVFHGRSLSVAADGGIFVGGNMVSFTQMGIVKLHGTAIPDPTPTPPPAQPTITGLTVKKASVDVSIAAQAEGLTYTARKMKPNGTAGRVTAYGDLPPGTRTLSLRTAGAMHGVHLTVTANGPGGASSTTVVWGRGTTGRIGACKPVRVTGVDFGAKTRVHFAKRKNSCARLVVGDRSRAVRKAKTSVLLPADTGRFVFRAGRARTLVVLR